MILVSACLAGINCKYDGSNNLNPEILKLVKKGLAIPVCPEQLGGLPTPRVPSEISNGKVLNKLGEDVTDKFKKGAEETLRIAKISGCSEVIFKQGSPSCGYGWIYDGSHTGRRIKGAGITSVLLEKNGIKIITEEEI